MLNHLSNRATKDVLNTAGFNDQFIDSFHESLKYTYHPTIDIFLENKKQFRSIGAHVIAQAIIPLENNQILFPQYDWYGDLFSMLDFENENSKPDYPSFVTLNYDRSLEHFLRMNIEYNCEDSKLDFCHNKRQKINIVHAHGSLGKYPDIPYGLDVNNPMMIKNAAENIRIVSDHLDNSPGFQEAQSIISKASNIVFFGFGYDETTLNKLLGPSDIGDKIFLGTGVGLKSNTITKLQTKFGENLFLAELLDCQHLLWQINQAMENNK
jgi:hypothetical protein